MLRCFVNGNEIVAFAQEKRCLRFLDFGDSSINMLHKLDCEIATMHRVVG